MVFQKGFFESEVGLNNFKFGTFVSTCINKEREEYNSL